MVQTLRANLCKIITASISAFLLSFVFGVGVGYGQTDLAIWNFEDVVTASNVDQNINASDITISSASINFQNGTDDGGTKIGYSGNWTTNNFDPELKHLQFTISPSAGFGIDLNSLSFRFGRTGTGPTRVTIQYSTDGFATTGTTILENGEISSENTDSLDSFTISDNLPEGDFEGTLTIRIWGHNANGSGNLRFNNFRVNGTVNVTGEDPILNVSTNIIEGLNFNEGSGPSDSKSFTLSGLNLDGTDVTLSTSTDIEVSGDNNTFSENVTLTSFDGTNTDIFVRLKEGLNINWYDESININGGGAAPVEVSVSGSVNPDHEFVETFETENYNLTGSYNDGSFEGITGVSWTYSESRDDAGFPINGDNAILLRGDKSPDYLSSLTSNTIGGGIDEFSVILRKGFTSSGNRQVALYIGSDSDNLDLIATSNAFDIDDELQRITVTDINYVGDYVMKIQATTDNQVVIDDISWNSYEDGNIELTSNEGFRMLSMPVSGVDLSTFLGPIWTQGATGSNGPEFVPNVFTWDNNSGANDAWQAVTNLNTETPAAGTGFLVYVYEDDDYYETNVVGGFPKTLTVSGAANSGDVIPTINTNSDGFTLLGNPYPTTIDWDNIHGTNTNDLQDVIYVWDVNEGYASESEVGLGSWKSYADGSGDFTNGLIAPFQGFFVKTVESPAGTPILTFDSASEATSGDSFYGKQKTPERMIVRLELSGKTMRSSTWLRFSENGSLENRVRGDALKLQPLSERYAQLSTAKTGETLLDINHLPLPNEEYSIPVYVTSTDGGNYTLTATDFELPSNIELEFHDHSRNISAPIDQNFEYSLQANSVKAKENLTIQEQLQNGPVAAKANNGEVRYSISVSGSLAGEPGNPDSELPDHVALEQNYPNPFNPATVINFDIPQQSHVRLAVYDLLGRQVDLLVNETRAAGTYNITWDASQLSSGVYIYRLETAGQTLTRQMTLIK